MKTSFSGSFFALFLLVALMVDFDPRLIKKERSFTLAAVGDINLGGKVAAAIKRQGHDYPWQQVQATLTSADLTFGNLECSLSDNGSPTPGKAYTFRGAPESAVAMAQAGFDVLSLANNHSLDYGRVALAETMAVLTGAQIRYCGAGEDLFSAAQPQIVKIRGQKIAFLGFSGVVPPGWEATGSRSGIASAKNLSFVAQQIQEARKQADIVIVSFHWGKELETSPSSWQRKLGRLAIDSGAAAVIGHHPHVVQGVEKYGQGIIAYSLGNFVFSPGSEAGKSSIILQLVFDNGQVREVRILPVKIVNYQPRVLGSSSAQKWLGEVQKRCLALGTELQLETDQAKVVYWQEKNPVNGVFFWRR